MKVLIAFHHPAPYKVKLFNELAKTIDLDVIFEINKAKNRTDSFYKFNQYNFKVIPVKLHRFPSKSSQEKMKTFLEEHSLDILENTIKNMTTSL